MGLDYYYCKDEIEDNGKCGFQCLHCKEYYKPLETKQQTLQLLQELTEIKSSSFILDDLQRRAKQLIKKI